MRHVVDPEPALVALLERIEGDQRLEHLVPELPDLVAIVRFEIFDLGALQQRLVGARVRHGAVEPLCELLDPQSVVLGELREHLGREQPERARDRPSDAACEW